MANITLALDDDLLREARKVAIGRDTTVNALVRDYLRELVQRNSYDADKTIAELEVLYARTSTRTGKRVWTRDELHDR